MRTKEAEIVEAEMWFEVQYSRLGENDWVSIDRRFGTKEKADQKKGQLAREREYSRNGVLLDFRIVRKAITTEVVQDAE